MPRQRYRVTRQRAYWVEETQIVVADSPDQAEDVFLSEWNPSLRVMEVYDPQIDTGMTVVPAKRPPGTAMRRRKGH